MKGECLMLVPETADGFRATISALRSLRESERMPETEIKGDLEALHVQVQAVM
jgi:hypothetical protein